MWGWRTTGGSGGALWEKRWIKELISALINKVDLYWVLFKINFLCLGVLLIFLYVVFSIFKYLMIMICNICSVIAEAPSNRIHVLRKCTGCGRETRVAQAGKDGHGLRVEKGDKFVLPSGFLKISFNPINSSGQMSRSGLAWFAGLINFEGLPKAKDDLMSNLEALRKRCDEIVERSTLLSDIDFEDESAGDIVFRRLEADHQNSAEWWAMSVIIFMDILRDAIAAQDLNLVVWAMGCVERCRAMLVFKENLEEPLMMAQAARRIIDILRIWDLNSKNSLEAFWQTTFGAHSYALSQAFSVPVVLIGEGAYVGGMAVDRKSAKYADFLYSHESSKEAMLVEIKTPITSLLGRPYRGTFQPSAELSGAVMQALDYRRSLAMDHGAAITAGTDHQLDAFSPRCIVLIGNGDQLDSVKKRNAFEMYRSNLRDVEVVTYDELFRKLEILASIFGLKRS